MRFTKGFYQKRSLSEGYQARFLEGAEASAAFSISYDGKSNLVSDDVLLGPRYLTIRAKLNPIFLERTNVFGQINRPDRSLSKCAVYSTKGDLGENSVLKAIQVVFEKNDSDILPFEKNAVLFEKSFVSQHSNITLDKIMCDQKIVIDSLGEEGDFQWGYGGYYRLGCPLSAIEQIFFTLTEHGKETQTFLTRASTWLQNGHLPWNSSTLWRHLGRRIVYQQGITQHSTLSLESQLKTGELKINVPLGVDEQGALVEECYQSTSVIVVDPYSHLLDIKLEKIIEDK